MNASICFIGAGNMARSLIGGLIASGFDKQKIIATDSIPEQCNAMTSQFGIQSTQDNNQAIQQSDIVVLCVKPQILKNVCHEIAPAIQQKNPLILSVVAGVQSEDINHWLGGGLAIVRTMPNTPALIQTGAAGLFANAQVNPTQKEQAENILRAAGLALWVETEAQLDAVTALSGSGPAYYFLFMEAMQEAGEQLGLSAKTAQLLTMQTAFGAAKMAMETSQDCQQLRKNVTSPNGTTEKAIQSFENDGLRQLVLNAMTAAKVRAEQLGKELGDH